MKQLIYILSACLGMWLPLHTHGQTKASDNKISESITFSEKPKGLSVYGIFEGRTPSGEISTEWKVRLSPADDRLKWQIILFRDSLTFKPTTFILEVGMSQRQTQKGTWKIIQGTKTNRVAVVYKLDVGPDGKPIYLLKGDENVLFILDENLEFRTGNQHFSFTLNRVHKVLRLSNR
ncbi:hypothetical protein [Parapedobacter tibetensis]|uniref:hypothetical protein n=1 Tax=Parapedobacter tibetensis TaxID=2972951 RepID=UPI00214D13A2|nr:hypothetical protein [Parapedobacter tibetensis]